MKCRWVWKGWVNFAISLILLDERHEGLTLNKVVQSNPDSWTIIFKKKIWGRFASFRTLPKPLYLQILNWHSITVLLVKWRSFSRLNLNDKLTNILSNVVISASFAASKNEKQILLNETSCVLFSKIKAGLICFQILHYFPIPRYVFF